jgi:hypothetical protein
VRASDDRLATVMHRAKGKQRQNALVADAPAR